ncbi:exonuclease domain-containing protein [Oceanobacillus halophilus]|uniref:3'-5' exonuclease n=1 Tax=Oceanobacillus halophilus TaxID=930130 RepID=A0A495A7B7_9BACI|nr:exonuclease domain-containing protein [Oceanobacillus halophilus]RKQ35623.1 3'-5' exonuclease [Oceanobacillus halophilus]
MSNNTFIQWMRQMYGKVHTTVYSSVKTNLKPENLAFLRNIEKEMNKQNSLFTPLSHLDAVVFDFETSGFIPEQGDQILSIGAIKLRNNRIEKEQTFYSLVQFTGTMSPEVRALTGLMESELRVAPPLAEVLLSFFEFVQDDVLIAHHATHEKRFLQYANWKVFKKVFQQRIVDTSLVFRIFPSKQPLISLDDYCFQYGVKLENRHHALGDAILTAKLWEIYTIKLIEEGYLTLHEVYGSLGKMKQ